jgi:hypothetical protein
MLREQILKHSGVLNEDDLSPLYENISEEDFEVLEEGLKFFKKSKQLRKYADKIERVMARKTDKGKEEYGRVLRDLVSRIKKLADKFDVIEQAFAKKEINRADARAKLKKLKVENQEILGKLKNDQIKKALKVFGILAIGAGIYAFLGPAGFGKQIVDMLSTTKLTTASSFAPVGGVAAGAGTSGSLGSVTVSSAARRGAARAPSKIASEMSRVYGGTYRPLK